MAKKSEPKDADTVQRSWGRICIRKIRDPEVTERNASDAHYQKNWLSLETIRQKMATMLPPEYLPKGSGIGGVTKAIEEIRKAHAGDGVSAGTSLRRRTAKVSKDGLKEKKTWYYGLKLQHRQPRDGQKHHTDYLRLKHVVLPETLNKEFIDAVPVENEASGKVIVEVDQEEFEEI
eukprot:gene4447-2309_t